MDRPKCEVKGCNNGAIMPFGGKFICGNCYMRIHDMNIAKQRALLDELENDKNELNAWFNTEVNEIEEENIL